MPVADELVTILGVEVGRNAMAKIEAMKKGLESVTKVTKGLSIAVAGYVTAAGLIIKGAGDQAVEMEKLARNTGLSTDALQEWKYASQQASGNANALLGDLGGLYKRFGMTGEKAEKTLLSLADRMKNMTDRQANALGKSWGLSEDTVALLKKGRDGVEELRKEAHKLGGIIPPEAIKIAANFKRQVGELQFALQGLTARVAIALIPAMSKLVDRFKAFLAENKEWIALSLGRIMDGIVKGFEEFLGVFDKIGTALKPVKDALEPFTKNLKLSEVVAHLVKGALLGLLLIFSPLIAKVALITAGIILAIAVFDDIWNSITKGKGITAELFKAFEERWPNLFNALKKFGKFIQENFIDWVMAGWEVIKFVMAGIGEVLGHVMNAFDQLAGPIAEFFGTFEERFPALFNMLSALASFVKDVLAGAFLVMVDIVKGVIDWLLTQLKAIGGFISGIVEKANAVADFLGFGDGGKEGSAKSVTDAASQAMDAVNQINAMAAQQQVPQNNTANNTSNTTNNVTVNVGDAEQARQVTRDYAPGQPANTPGPTPQAA